MRKPSLGRSAPATKTPEGGSGALRVGARLAILAALLWAGEALAQTPAAIEQARAAVVAHSDLQLQLPGAAEPSPLPSISIPTEFLWALVVLGVLFVLYHLRDIIPGWRRSAVEEWAASGDGAGLTGQSPADILLTADELAREGRYVEAMHVLLLKGLADIRQRLNEQFADSLTSREIMRRARLSDAGAAALSDIVLGVERTYFGEHPAGPPEYEACRRRFDALNAALAAQAQAAHAIPAQATP
jgi:hypothetical protein